eukprot:6214062-Pleurochrysis_carterae.AAC.1
MTVTRSKRNSRTSSSSKGPWYGSNLALIRILSNGDLVRSSMVLSSLSRAAASMATVAGTIPNSSIGNSGASCSQSWAVALHTMPQKAGSKLRNAGLEVESKARKAARSICIG